MRKLILLIIITIFVSELSHSQLRIKAGINYNSPDLFDNVPGFRFGDSRTSTGYHIGLSYNTKLHLGDLNIRTEINYSVLKNEIEYNYVDYLGINIFGLFLPESATFILNKIDIPILLEKKVFKIASIFAGPSLHHMINSKIDIDGIKGNSIHNFFLGIHVGAEIRFGKVGLDIRWEKSITNSRIRFADNRTLLDALDISNNVGNYFDGRTNQLIISIFYAL